MDQFVCVRIVKGNTLDLSLFQFDYDLTFAMVFMNADKTIYGRYGTRDSREDAEKDIKLKGLRTALQGALSLHRGYPANKTSLAGKQPRPTKYKTPLDYPDLAKKYKKNLDYSGQVSKSCIHCHQVRVAELLTYRNAGEPIPDEVFFSYPRPEVIGLTLNPETRATVSKIEKNSPVENAGLKSGDKILTLNGQNILSIADVQWVLHGARQPSELQVLVQRGKRKVPLTVSLKENWRRAGDLTWRASIWSFRRMVSGGMVLEELPEKERRRKKIDSSKLALRIKGMGRYGDHGIARRTGFKEGDILVDYNGISKRVTESQLYALAVQNTKPGQRISITLLRGGKRMTLKLSLK